jgi:hypothetical protein
VHRDVLDLVALDLVLRFILAAAMDMLFVVNVLRVDLDDFAADVSGLRIPDHMIVRLKRFAIEVISVAASPGDLNVRVNDVKIEAPKRLSSDRPVHATVLPHQPDCNFYAPCSPSQPPNAMLKAATIPAVASAKQLRRTATSAANLAPE